MSTLTTTELPLKPGAWAIDDAHSTANFSVRHLGLAKVRGRFATFNGTVTVGDSVEATQVTAEIDLIPLGGGKVAIGDKVSIELDVQLVAP